jgi:hypothetical protein
MGVWPDAYYETYNVFANGTTFSGSKLCAFDRSKMLNGAAATQQCFQLSSLFGGVLPADLDGATLPPAGSPNYMVALDTATTLANWKFHVDFITPANTTLTGPTSISVPAYTSSCSTVARGACIPQGGTNQRLESLADRLMHRLAYRNFGDHESLVVNHTIEVGSGSSLHSGVRWYELRPSGGNLTLFQSGTYAPDANWRWMGSIAMDRSGNIGIGYSVSSSSISPQIHFTGRLAADAAGTMTQGESIVINGAGSQTGGLARWGDYSMMGIDPGDDCTFWYTQEYLKASGSFNWSTRINSFKLPNCGAAPTPDFSLSASPTSQTVTQGTSASYSVTVTRSGGFTGGVTLSMSSSPTGLTGTFNPNPETGTGSTLTVPTSSSTATGTYTITISGTGTGVPTHTTTVTLVVNSPAAGDFSLALNPTTATVRAGNSATYTVNITRTGGFTGAVAFTISGLPAGDTGSFNPASTTGNSSTLTIRTTATINGRTDSFTVTGTSGTLKHTVNGTLTVTPGCVGGDGDC